MILSGIWLIKWYEVHEDKEILAVPTPSFSDN